MYRFFRRICLFTVGLLLLLVFKKIATPFTIGDIIFKSKYSYYQDHQNQYNAVVFGSSRLYRQVNSLLLDSFLLAQNFSTYNFSIGGTYNPESYFLYENFLETIDSGSVKYAILELQQLHSYDERNIRTTKASYWNTTSYLKFSLNYIKSSNYPDSIKSNLHFSYLKSFIFSFIDFTIFKNLIRSTNRREIGLNGFYPLEQENKESIYTKRHTDFQLDTLQLTKRIQAATFPIKSHTGNVVNKTHLDFLLGLIEKSKQKGLFIFFIVPPRLNETQYQELVPLAEKLPKKNFIELYEYPKYKKLYQAQYSFDIGHLNTKGANLFTKYLAREITTRTSPAYNANLVK